MGYSYLGAGLLDEVEGNDLTPEIAFVDRFIKDDLIHFLQL